MTLVEILLPVRDNRGRAQPKAAFADLRRLLVERFGGVTAFTRVPAPGAWVSADDSARREEVIVLQVLTDYLDRTWWSALKARLEARFRQETIMIRAFPVETL